MFIHLRILWLLLLLHVTASAFNLNLFNGKPELREGDVRLFGSKNVSEGRVEIYHEGKWGTVCDDGWDMAAAQVLCRQLHFPGAKSVVTGKDYGKVSGPIWLDDIRCKGTESHLTSCDFKSWGVSDCSHKEDVGVICETGDTNFDDRTHFLDHSIGLSDDLGKIFDSGIDCDFLILVQSETGNKQGDGTPEVAETTICAHKLILSQFPLFNTSRVSNITVSLSQSCQPHFTTFIRYIYTRKTDMTFSSVQCLHWMASKFGVKELMEAAARLFTKVIPEDNSFHTQLSLYEYAEETGDLVLQESCCQYLAWNFQNLTRSPAWTSISVELLAALLSRSDMIVPDEYFLLQVVESWITEKGKAASLETQVDLLSHIRFPMIPAEKLYELESKSSLSSTHKNMYRENMLKAYQFNVLLFSNLSTPNFNKNDDAYQPRIYTTEPWSTTIDPSKKTSRNPGRNSFNSGSRSYHNSGYYDYNRGVVYYSQAPAMSFSTPVHSSLIFKNNKIRWEANVFMTNSECSSYGLRCESAPAARLVQSSHVTQESNILFRNRLLLLCQGKYVCQVQDFKVNWAYITANGTQGVAYPCPDDQYTYQFVVRPEYV